MKTPNETTDQATEAAPAKKPGRPAKHDSGPMSAKYRAAAYRMRRREAASMAHEHLQDADSPVLLAGLVRKLRELDRIDDPERIEICRYLAGELMAELCDRYEIELPRSPAQ